MKIQWFLDTGFANCDYEDEIEVPDDATEDEIDEIAKTEAFNCVEWGWRKV